jgi:hypothetical protein
MINIFLFILLTPDYYGLRMVLVFLIGWVHFFIFFNTLLDFGFFFFYSSLYLVFSNLPRPPLL